MERYSETRTLTVNIVSSELDPFVENYFEFEFMQQIRTHTNTSIESTKHITIAQTTGQRYCRC